MILCGKELNNGETTFIQLVRVDAETQECPTKMKRCSPNTSPENTICIGDAEDMSNCPITSMMTVNATEKDIFLANENYTVVDANIQGRYLVFSRTVADNLPVGELRVENKPCFNTDDVSSSLPFLPHFNSVKGL